MIRHGHLALRLAVLAALGAGCTPREEEELTESELSSELAEFRTEVTEALDEVRMELADMQDRVEPAATEAWTDLSDATERARSEVMANLDRLSNATADEARDIQRAAAERLAELEAEVARAEISSKDAADSLLVAANDQLMDIESDIDALTEMHEEHVVDATVQGDTVAMADQETLAFQERVGEIRTELLEVVRVQEEEAFAASRDQLSDQIAALTEEVRREWYERKWGIES